MAKIKCVINHPNLHFAVAGKLQQMQKGSTITVEEDHVQRHLNNGSLKRFDDGEAVAVGEPGDSELRALRERATELGVVNANKMKTETLKQKIEEAEAALSHGE